MDEGLYFGSSPENAAEITIDCRNTDKPNGFEIGQPGKGSGFNANPLPSGVAAEETVTLTNAVCRIKPKYITSIQGRLCCIREQHEQEVTVDIIEKDGFRRCTVPLECIEIPEDPLTISEMCLALSRCMTRYLNAENPNVLQTEKAQITKQFLETWIELP